LKRASKGEYSEKGGARKKTRTSFCERRLWLFVTSEGVDLNSVWREARARVRAYGEWGGKGEGTRSEGGKMTELSRDKVGLVVRAVTHFRREQGGCGGP